MKLENLTPEQQKEWQALQDENKRLHEKLQTMETVQAISALGNSASTILTRPEFVREIARMVAHDERYGGISCLLVMSFDGLLEHKTKLGASLYDHLMKVITETVIGGVRACDVVGRTGSNDFSIMLTRCKLDDAEKKAEALITTIKQKLDPLLSGKAAIELSYVVSILNNRDDAKKSLPPK